MEKLGKSRQDIKREIKNIYERSKKFTSSQDNERARKNSRKSELEDGKQINEFEKKYSA
jgi:hypothetical protein